RAMRYGGSSSPTSPTRRRHPPPSRPPALDFRSPDPFGRADAADAPSPPAAHLSRQQLATEPVNPTTNTAADLVPWEPARPLTAHAFARIEAERPSPTAEDDERAYKEWAALDATRFGPVLPSQPPVPPAGLVPIKEVARRLGYSVRLVPKVLNALGVPVLKVTKKTQFVRRSDLDAALAVRPDILYGPRHE